MTLIEVEQKQKALQTQGDTAFKNAQKLQSGTAEYDEQYSIYLSAKAAIANIPNELAKARKEANAEGLAAAAKTVSEGIAQLLAGLNVSDLLGERVIKVSWTQLDAAITPDVRFNATTRISPGAKAKDSKGGRTMIVDAQGNRQSCTKFVNATCTAEEKASKDFKYPHTRIDTKPKFDAYCLAHNLTGLEYEVNTNGDNAQS